MPPIQRTFELVPTTLARPLTVRPPMTSKAAKKAYQKANAGPKVSRAEQRKRDAAELERLRKEHEKERAAAKARAVREKKAAKAAEEKEARRKMGLPEPSRFVRASQGSIAFFARGKGDGKRTWREMDSVVEESGTTADEAEEENECEAEPPSKRVALDYECQAGDTKVADGPDSVEQTTTIDSFLKDECSTIKATLNIECQIGDADRKYTGSLVEKVVLPDSESDDEFGEFPSLTQTDILVKISSSACSVRQTQTAPASPQQNFCKGGEMQIQTPLPKPPGREIVTEEDEFDDGMVSTQFFTEAIEIVSRIESKVATTAVEVNAIDRDLRPVIRVGRSPSKSAIRPKAEGTGTYERSSIRPTTRVMTTREEHTGLKQIPAAQRPALSQRPVNMPPPQLPPKKHTITRPVATSNVQAKFTPQVSRMATPTRSAFVAKPNFVVDERKSMQMPPPPPRRPHFLPGNQKAKKHSATEPPSATQAFLEEHMEDFFPSPTQERRELSEILVDDDDVLLSNAQSARDTSPSKSAHQPLISNRDDFQFFSTQDVMISSQDMCEINTPNSTPISLPKAVPAPALPQPVLKEKKRFFEEKDEDLRQAGLLEVSEKANAEVYQTVVEYAQPIISSVDSPSMQAAMAESKELSELEEIRRLADASFDNFDDDLEQVTRVSQKVTLQTTVMDSSQEEMESLKAAMKESERLAKLESQRVELGLGSRRYFQEKEEDQLKAALWESKLLDELQRKQKQQQNEEQNQEMNYPPEPGNKPNSTLCTKVDDAPLRVNEKRSLKRVASSVTDYGGDDDLISSQELLAFCDGFDT